MSAEVRLLAPVDAALGEGLCWDTDRGCLWMVDIVGRRLLRVSPEGGRFEAWHSPEEIGWVIPRDGDLLIGLASGVARAVLHGTALEPAWITRLHVDRPEMRLNDAKSDSSGAIWAGSLNRRDESWPDGVLYRIARDGATTVVDTGYAVANGPAIRKDERLMLHTDSVRRTVYAFDLDVAAGRLSGKRVWRQFTQADGHPDGMCFDSEGCLWIAHWGAGMLCRYAPDGSVLRRVSIPATNVTNVCFFGPDLSRLAVTTARNPPSSQACSGSLDGALLEVLEPGACGLR